jgi:copper transport protein
MDMGENTVLAKKDSSGNYVIKGIYTNMAGKWNIKVHVLTTSLDSLDSSFKFNVGSK